MIKQATCDVTPPPHARVGEDPVFYMGICSPSNKTAPLRFPLEPAAPSMRSRAASGPRSPDDLVDPRSRFRTVKRARGQPTTPRANHPTPLRSILSPKKSKICVKNLPADEPRQRAQRLSSLEEDESQADKDKKSLSKRKAPSKNGATKPRPKKTLPSQRESGEFFFEKEARRDMHEYLATLWLLNLLWTLLQKTKEKSGVFTKDGAQEADHDAKTNRGSTVSTPVESSARRGGKTRKH
ncbi:hypothetical protein C8R45DRAFT_934998 [Mycena sanguinolenta]|nr:hypothetical protein C8R45DRAFT_934998 [Mycena sanguinolenta]